MKSKHTKEKSFGCKTCNKHFVTSSDLKIVGQIHAEEKTFGCTLCEQIFSQKDGLNQHLRRNHVKEKNYGCQFCRKQFATKYESKLHERKQAGDKPYKM